MAFGAAGAAGAVVGFEAGHIGNLHSPWVFARPEIGASAAVVVAAFAGFGMDCSGFRMNSPEQRRRSRVLATPIHQPSAAATLDEGTVTEECQKDSWWQEGNFGVVDFVSVVPVGSPRMDWSKVMKVRRRPVSGKGMGCCQSTETR